jgi:hypothetical protein
VRVRVRARVYMCCRKLEFITDRTYFVTCSILYCIWYLYMHVSHNNKLLILSLLLQVSFRLYAFLVAMVTFNMKCKFV